MNKAIGDRYESKLLDLMAKNGWWCHLFAYKSEGQPCDVVALKNNVPLLIDVKHCEKDRFSFDNIRPNQRNCFQLAYNKGNTNCGFAIYFEHQHCWKWLEYREVVNLESFGYKSIGFKMCDDFLWN